MARSRNPRLGHLSVRVPVETHQQLLDVAAVLNIDVSGLVNQILAAGLPPFVEKATELARRQKAAREEFEAITYSLPDTPSAVPLIKLAMDAGRLVESEEERWEAMVRSIKDKAPKVTIAVLVTRAWEELRKEIEQKQIEEAVERMAAGDTPEEEMELP